ncbi:MAG: hypothetical protein IPF68_06715 [Bacteroidales bacterium]|nr:hypothetical protein [Bacteroidales bacterium]
MRRTSRLFYLILVLLVPFVISCLPDDELGPDTGDPRDKFTGSWNFNETPAARGISYPVNITYDDNNSSRVYLSNFARAGSGFLAYGIVTSNRITVPYQETAPGFYVEGSGTMSTVDAMDWEYSYSAGGDMESFTAYATK